jgi:hypothetical protein
MGLCPALQWNVGGSTGATPKQFVDCGCSGSRSSLSAVTVETVPRSSRKQFVDCDCCKQGVRFRYGEVVIRGCPPRSTNQALRPPRDLRSIGPRDSGFFLIQVQQESDHWAPPSGANIARRVLGNLQGGTPVPLEPGQGAVIPVK